MLISFFPQTFVPLLKMDGKRKHMFDDSENEDEIEAESKKSIPKHIRKQDKRLIIILEKAHLETIKVTLYC